MQPRKGPPAQPPGDREERPLRLWELSSELVAAVLALASANAELRDMVLELEGEDLGLLRPSHLPTEVARRCGSRGRLAERVESMLEGRLWPSPVRAEPLLLWDRAWEHTWAGAHPAPKVAALLWVLGRTRSNVAQLHLQRVLSELPWRSLGAMGKPPCADFVRPIRLSPRDRGTPVERTSSGRSGSVPATGGRLWSGLRPADQAQCRSPGASCPVRATYST